MTSCYTDDFYNLYQFNYYGNSQYQQQQQQNCFDCSTLLNGNIAIAGVSDVQYSDYFNHQNQRSNLHQYNNATQDLSFAGTKSLLLPAALPSSQLSELSYPAEQTSLLDAITKPISLITSNNQEERNKESVRNYICPTCNHRSKRKHNLIEHMLTHNPDRPKSFLCSHCSRPFARKYDMKRHEKIHRNK